MSLARRFFSRYFLGRPGVPGAEKSRMIANKNGDVVLTDDELAQGGYRYEDLVALRVVSNRTDLHRKQNDLGFPKPVKTGARQAWFPRAEVNVWLRQRAALRESPDQVAAGGKSNPTKSSRIICAKLTA
jgi:predicted DNA-binding transcriptional regulator AlpA